MSGLNKKTLTSKELRFFFDVSTVAVASCVVLEMLFPGMSAKFAGWPFVASLLVVGMPHGAVDFRLNSQLKSASGITAQLLAFAGYLSTLGLVLLLFSWQPLVTLLAFLLLSGLHFGLADARSVERLASTTSPSAIRWSAAVARGAVIVGLPFLVAPAAATSLFVDVAGIVGQSISPGLTVVRTVAGTICCVGLAAQLIVVVHRLIAKQWSTLRTDLIEGVALVLAFTVLHPVFATGLYVLAWHSWRHMQPLAEFFHSNVESAKTYRGLTSSVARIHLYALPLLLPTWALFAALALWRIESWTSTSLAAATVAIFVVVTLPHHLLVERLFRRRNSTEHSTRSSVVRQRSTNGSLANVSLPFGASHVEG